MNAYLVTVAIPDPATQPPVSGAASIPDVGHYWVLQAMNIVGREAAPDVAIVLPWITVSRRHAEIELFANGLWELVDRASRNGTFVNGQLVFKGALTPLNDGDRIRIGDCELVFCFHLDPMAPPPESDNPHA